MEASYLDSHALRYSHIIDSVWQRGIPLNKNDTAYTTGQNLTAHGTIECEIWLNGIRLVHQASSERYDIVICTTVIP